MITFKELEDANFDTKGISNKPVCGRCVRCGTDFQYSSVKKFMRNRKNKLSKKSLWATCGACWFKINTAEDPQWIERNSDVQKIAQNKPEQKRKNAEGVAKSWTPDRRRKHSKLMKHKIANDPEYHAYLVDTLKPYNSGLNVKGGYGSGGLKGIYNDIKYDSALELSFILWCENKEIPIRRYDLYPVVYEDEDQIERCYYPDFIINEDEIVEIKGSGLWFNKNYQRNQLKTKAAKKLFRSYVVMFDSDEAVKTFYKSARKIHHEAKE